jgi:hypothetical protein
MYLVIGVIVATANAMMFRPGSGDTAIDRSLGLMTDIVGWPRFLVLAARTVDGHLTTSLP